ncbi:MAG: glycosyltransferase family 2 protein, partial [Clostridium sp.]
LQRDSLKNIVKPFLKNKNTIGVGGNIKISNFITIRDGEVSGSKNYKGLIECFQVIEYLRAFLFSRLALDKWNMNLIISGAFGAFKKDAVIRILGYKSDTVGEDMELVMRLHKYFMKSGEEYKIAFAPDAICYTQAPGNLEGLKSQRVRWQIGLIHCMMIHKEMVISFRWFFSKLYFMFFELFTPLIEFFGLVYLIITIFMGRVDLGFLTLYTLIILVNGFFISVFSIVLDGYLFQRKNSKFQTIKLCIISIFEGIGYRQVVSVFRFLAFLRFKNNKNKWGNIKREFQN